MTAPAEPERCTSPGRHDSFSRHHVPCSGPASERSRSPDGYFRLINSRGPPGLALLAKSPDRPNIVSAWRISFSAALVVDLERIGVMRNTRNAYLRGRRFWLLTVPSDCCEGAGRSPR